MTISSFVMSLPSSSKGNSIIEVMIVILIVTVGLVGGYKIITSGKNVATTTASRIQAIALAREWLEIMTNIRDTNWIKFSSDYQGCFDALNYNPLCIGNTATDATKIVAGSYIPVFSGGVWELQPVPSPENPNTNRGTYMTQFPVYLTGSGLTTQTGVAPPSAFCSETQNTSCKTKFTRELIIERPDPQTIIAKAKITWIDSTRSTPFSIEVPTTLTNWKYSFYR